MSKSIFSRKFFILENLIYKRIQPTASLSIRGKKLSIPIGRDGTLRIIFWQESWKTKLIEQLLSISDGTFIDIGANMGQTLLDFVSSCPDQPDHYFGFEPNPVCVAYLEELIRINQLIGCSVIPVGLSDTSEIMPLYVNLDDPADVSASMIKEARQKQITMEKLVPSYRFDDVWGKIGINPIGVIKIDVEGNELNVLKGMQNNLMEFRPYIICEVLHAGKTVDITTYAEQKNSLMRFLENSDYVVFKIMINTQNNLSGLEKISSFPIKQWSDESIRECDYLFSPIEKVDFAVQAIKI